MILDNENRNPKVYEWIERYTAEGSINIVTGYFTVSALAWLSKQTKDKIKQFRFVLGDIVNHDSELVDALDLLNVELSVEGAMQLSMLAQEAVHFLDLQQVEVKTLEPNFCHAKMYLYQAADQDPQRNYYITGSSNLTDAGIGRKATNNIELNQAGFGSAADYRELVQWFEELWKKPQAHYKKTIRLENGKTDKIPFKEYLIREISKIFDQYSPFQLYYKILFELFGTDLMADAQDPDFSKQIGKLENTKIWTALYEFQQKGVLSLIRMLQKYNGAILADAVGLGKTWQALAVIKFFSMKGYEVILFCPKKLEQNWAKFLETGNRFDADKFDYKMRFHTDLEDGRFEKYTGYNAYTKVNLHNSKPKLIVIDESHNLRNNKSSRYQYLLEELLRPAEGELKVLLLSATPINNSLNDVRNQYHLIAKGNEHAFEDTSIDVRHIGGLFRQAQSAYKKWNEMPGRTIRQFIDMLPGQFFRLTDALTVARTRKLIAGFKNNLEFPQKAAPENLFVTPEKIGNFENFDELFDKFPPRLSAYRPSFYTETEAERTERKSKAKTRTTVLEDDQQREYFLVKMMYILLVKRLESSWKSFHDTVNRILEHHQTALSRISDYQDIKVDISISKEQQTSLFSDDDDLEGLLDQFSLGKKRPISLKDIDTAGQLELYKKHLKEDIDALELLQSNLHKFDTKIDKETNKPGNRRSADNKLETLISKIVAKQASGQNNHNQKVVIFTVYTDTALYLYEQLCKRGFANVGLVTGSISKTSSGETGGKKFEYILERFAPMTKIFGEKEWDFHPSSGTLSQQYEEWLNWTKGKHPAVWQKIQQPIDILIATDVLSEGQNLQDADMVINYDIHWNPVRVIQRLGRIDRLGSPNQKIYSINFWPTDNINNYLNLQGRIEQRMATMMLAGAEVDTNFSETFREMADDERLEQRQKNRMLEQMQTSLDDIDTEKSIGFDNFSLEMFRQDLMEELRKNADHYKALPNGIYSGFEGLTGTNAPKGMIALLGYPGRSGNATTHRYKSYDLLYIDAEGRALMPNQKEVLEVLAKHKDCPRDNTGLNPIDSGDPEQIQKLSAALKSWLDAQTKEDTTLPDGSIKTKMGKASLDLIKKIKSGSKEAQQQLKQEGPAAEKYRADKVDLIAWLIVNE
jgi:superfamily II DNA or RNA helicase